MHAFQSLLDKLTRIHHQFFVHILKANWWMMYQYSPNYWNREFYFVAYTLMDNKEYSSFYSSRGFYSNLENIVYFIDT